MTTIREHEAKVAADFTKDISEHQLTIVKNDGLYRNLLFKKPGTSFYWFELVTWPGKLVISGDTGSFMFARIPDMFEFFRKSPGYINAPYWAQKLIAHDTYQRYSADRFRERINEQLVEWLEDINDGDKRASLEESVKDEVLAESEYESTAREALDSFRHDDHEFYDTWEWDFNEYTYQFLWCLHAIVHGIAMYDAAIGAVPAAPDLGQRPVETAVVAGGVL